jgi:hypothetical protein
MSRPCDGCNNPTDVRRWKRLDATEALALLNGRMFHSGVAVPLSTETKIEIDKRCKWDEP